MLILTEFSVDYDILWAWKAKEGTEWDKRMGTVKAILFAVLHVGLLIGEALVVGGTASSITEAWCFIQQKYLCCKMKYLFSLKRYITYNAV